MRCAFLVVVIFAIVGFILDYLRNSCVQNNREAAAVLALHHLVFTFSLFGWLFDDPIILIVYIVLLPVVWLHWQTSDMCFVDKVTANLCGGPKDFQHLARQVNLPHQVLPIWAWIGTAIAVYKLYWIFTRRPRGPVKKVRPIWDMGPIRPEARLWGPFHQSELR